MHEHKWTVENMNQMDSVTAIVVCLECKTVKKTMPRGDYVIEGSEAERVRNSEIKTPLIAPDASKENGPKL